ncbi:MAG: type IV pilus modification PilV family protein [Chloroflexota bacterium]
MPRTDHRESGFTIIEVLVAIVILVMGALATFSLLSAANRNTDRAKASQVAQDLAQQELEALHSLSNEELALTATPPPSSDPLDPGYRVSGDRFAVEREPLGSYDKLVVEGGEIEGEPEKTIKGGVVKPSESFKTGDVSGTVYRYVVWRNDEACGEACPTAQDYKQIIVAVKLNTPATQTGERGYVEAQSDFVDPAHSSEKDPAPNGEGKLVTAQQFFLTDTPCSASGTTTRQQITEDHLLHNTLGTCASGPQTESTPGAPDALLLGGPPDPAPEDPENPPLYDYSNDSYLEPTPDTDKGVQILRDDTAGCHYVPTGTTHPEAQVHRWVTDPMAAEFKMTGRVTIEFYTRTLNDALYTGKLCVYLFKREETGSPPAATDTMLTNKKGGTAYWTYSPEGNEYWPRYSWTKVRLTMYFNEAPYKIPAEDRLGVALSVERNGTQAEAIPIMYDNPADPTRIEVDTSTPLAGE